MGTTKKIREVQGILKASDIDGCITGSSLLDCDFDEWESAPDVDVFTYTEPMLLHAADILMLKHSFKPLTKGEEWKLQRIKERGMQRNAALSTVKLKAPDSSAYAGVVVNITYKKNKRTMFDVLASFDMTIIMRGYDIRKKIGLDLRSGWNGMVFADIDGRWPSDPKVAVPNPLRTQDTDMYSVGMWVRQFDRVVKYWNRGFDTRPMARFYLDSINAVLETGSLFNTEKALGAYNEFVSEYEPMRDKIKAWLDSKEDC